MNSGGKQLKTSVNLAIKKIKASFLRSQNFTEGCGFCEMTRNANMENNVYCPDCKIMKFFGTTCHQYLIDSVDDCQSKGRKKTFHMTAVFDLDKNCPHCVDWAEATVKKLKSLLR